MTVIYWTGVDKLLCLDSGRDKKKALDSHMWTRLAMGSTATVEGTG